MAAAAIHHRVEKGIQDQTQASLEGIYNLHKEVAQTPGAPTSTLDILIYLSQLICYSLRGT